jgi:hypothetical protein
MSVVIDLLLGILEGAALPDSWKDRFTMAALVGFPLVALVASIVFFAPVSLQRWSLTVLSSSVVFGLIVLPFSLVYLVREDSDRAPAVFSLVAAVLALVLPWFAGSV